jgi:hypothetical protein
VPKNSADKQARRVAVLLDFRERALASGHAVPSAEDMRRIAETAEVWPSGINVALAEPWRKTIVELLKQMRFGVVDPIDTLEPALRRPSGEVVASRSRHAAPETTVRDVVLAALQRWREDQQGQNPLLRSLKDIYLINIARTGSRATSEIAKHLPKSLAGVAGEMAEVIAATDQAPADPPTLRTPLHARSATGPGSRGPTGEQTTAELRVPTLPADASSHRSPSSTQPSSTPSVAPPSSPPLSSTAPQAGQPPIGEQPSGATASDADPSEEDRLKALYYADGDYATNPPELTIRRHRTPDGEIVLRWPPAAPGAAGDVTLYRVVSVDGFVEPRRPQDAAPLTVTLGHVCVDSRPFAAAVRYIRVWCHRGHSEEAAAAAVPVLHAGLALVAPPREPFVEEDSGRVVGRWSVFSGVGRVDVKRYVAAERGDPGAQPVVIEWGEGNLGGFVDDGVERGGRYVYTVAAELALEGGRHLSDAVEIPVSVAGELMSVEDLDVKENGDLVNLSWTPPPLGEVAIYRTPEGPAAGARTRLLQVAELEDRAGLPRSAQLRWPPSPAEGGRHVVYGVGFLPQLTRMYLTPVTIADGQARVGKTIPSVRLPRIDHAAIVERTHRQVFTFGWPQDADAVWVWIGPRGMPAEASMAEEPEEITAEQYRNQGGMLFRQPLPQRGCAVHARAVTFSQGRNVLGPPLTVEYPGLARLRYTVGVASDPTGSRVRLTVQIFAELDSPSAPPFMLVLNTERLPLHMRDGYEISMAAMRDPGAVEGPQFRPSALWTHPEAAWTAEGPAMAGYVRLFVCLPTEQQETVALLDPPVSALRLPWPPGPQR